MWSYNVLRVAVLHAQPLGARLVVSPSARQSGLDDDDDLDDELSLSDSDDNSEGVDVP